MNDLFEVKNELFAVKNNALVKLKKDLVCTSKYPEYHNIFMENMKSKYENTMLYEYNKLKEEMKSLHNDTKELDAQNPSKILKINNPKYKTNTKDYQQLYYH
jgi:hypothetical protein